MACEAEVVTVCRVVAVAGEIALMAPIPNDPSPQRHEQSHAPFERIVPVPAAIPPGLPTAAEGFVRLQNIEWA